MSRSIFPSFEKPVERTQFLNVRQERRRFRGIGAVLVLAAVSGVGFALWEPSHPVRGRSMAAIAATPAFDSKIAETSAVAAADDDQSAPTVKQSTFCSQRTSARRACADVKALKEARLTAPLPAPAKSESAAAKPAPSAKQPASATQATATVTAAPVAGAPAVQPQKKQAAPKVAKRRIQENASGERLVQRRVARGYDTGAGEYRFSRRANLEQPSGRFFSLY